MEDLGTYQGIRGARSGFHIGGTRFFTGSGSPNGTVTAGRIGDVYIDYTNGTMYQASATGTSSWSAVTSLTDTLWLPAMGALPRASIGAAEASPAETSTYKVNYGYLDFDPDTDEFCQWQFKLPHDYDGGTVTAQVVWGAGSGTGNVIWGVQGVSFADLGTLDSDFGTAVTVTDALSATSKIHITSATGAMTFAGSPAADQWAVIQLYRDANATGDTLTADARMIGVILTYTKKMS